MPIIHYRFHIIYILLCIDTNIYIHKQYIWGDEMTNMDKEEKNELEIEEQREWYTKAEVVDLLGISPSTVYHYSKQGKIRKVKDPHRIYREARYIKEDVDELIKIQKKPEGLRPSEISKQLGITQEMVYKYIREGILHAKIVPFGDERTTYVIPHDSFAEFKHFLEEHRINEPTKARKTDYYDSKRDIALFQKFRSPSSGNARLVRDAENEWIFYVLANHKEIKYKDGVEIYEFQPAYQLHQAPVNDKGYSLVTVPKDQSILYPFIDYLYEVWGVENVRLRDTGTIVEIYVQAGLKPFTNVDFSLREILPFVKEGEWLLIGSDLLIKSAYRKTSVELPSEMLDKLRDISKKRHITMSKAIELLLEKPLDDLFEESQEQERNIDN